MKRSYQMFILYVVIGLSWASTFLYTPTLSTYAASLGATGGMIGAITSGFGIMQLLGRAPAGMLSDYLGKSRGIMIAGMTAAFLAPLGMLIFPTPAGLMVFRTISGINAAIWPVFTAAVVSFYEREQTPHIISRCNLINALGNIFGMLLGGWLVERFSQNAAFLGASALGLLGLCLTLCIQETKRGAGSRSSLRAMARFVKDKRLMFLGLMVMVFQLIITSTSMTFTPVLAKSLGATAEELGVLTMLSMVGMLLASLVSVRYTKLLGGVRTAIMTALLILAAGTVAIGQCQSLRLLYLLQLIQGFGGYMVIVVLMGDSLLPYGDNERGAAGGLFQSVFAVGMILGPIVSGAFYEIMALDKLYLLLALFPSAAAVLMFALYKKLDAGWRSDDNPY